MKRQIFLVSVALVTTSFAFLDAAPPPQYAVQGTVTLAPSSPLLTAVDPFANAVSSSDGLKPSRPFWYSVNSEGLTILSITDNRVLTTIPWPQAIDVALPDGEYMTVPAPPGGWEPVGMVVSYPTEEQLMSNSETPGTGIYVVMAHSGYEWASDPNPPDLRSPNLRDTLVPSTNPDRESSMLVFLDVTDPSFAVTPPLFAAGILGHGAGQPAYDPGTGSVYVGNEPSTSLPVRPAVPNDLSSFVSVIWGLASPAAEAAAGEVGGGDVPTILHLCGPEHPDEGLLAGVPYLWPCAAEGGTGPFIWQFQNMPDWLHAHADKLTGDLDGLLYGTPPADGIYPFQVRLTDYGVDPPFTSEWETITLTVMPAGVAGEAEAEFEVGMAGGVPLEGTGTCDLAPTSSPGSLVPKWFDIVEVPGREIPNPTSPEGHDHTIGCILMGTPPISGEYFEFTLPNFKFAYPFNQLPVTVSGQVSGPYMFTPLPTGVTLSGLAWHQIDKTHDPSTEADLLNAEMFGVEPSTGQVYRILMPYSELEVVEAAAPPATEGELNEVSVFATSADMLAALTAARPDIANALAANPNLRVRFGDLVVEANPHPNILVSAREIFDPTGVEPAIAIGGLAGSTIPNGALLKVSGSRVSGEPENVTMSTISAIALPTVHAYSLGLDSDLRPAVKGQLGVPDEPGQVDHGALWVTGLTTGNIAVIDTALGQSAQILAVPGATSLGGVSVDIARREAYVAGASLQNVTIFGTGGASPLKAPELWGALPTVGYEAAWYTGYSGSLTITATGSPMPTLSLTGALPAGLTFVNHGNGTATLAGSPAEGTYSFTVTATNGVLPNASQPVNVSVSAPLAPAILSINATAFRVGSPGAFTVMATGGPAPTLTVTGALPGGVTIVNNGTFVTLVGIPVVGSEGSYPLTLTATNGVLPDATQSFTLTVNPPLVAPAISSGASASFAIRSPGLFSITATGSPTPTLFLGGLLPDGMTFVDNGNGTGTLAGTPIYGTQGKHLLAITAWTGLSPAAIQNFTLTVTGARVTDDYDRDGVADLAVWNGLDGWWHVFKSSPGSGDTALQQWGNSASGDVPVPGDYDGDLRTDLAIWRPSDGGWYVLTSGSGYAYESALIKQWGSGAAGDVPIPGDYDGDAQTDFAIWRPSQGVWYVLTSSSGYDYGAALYKQWGSGALGDIPVPADYDGDGQTDFAIWRPSEGVWYVLTSTSGYDYAAALYKLWGSGVQGDIPVPADYDGDGKTDLAVWRPSEGVWFVLTSTSGYDYAAALYRQWGSGAEADVPVPGDYDGDGRADLAVWRPSLGIWFVLTSTTGYSYSGALTTQWGGTVGDIAVRELSVKKPSIP